MKRYFMGLALFCVAGLGYASFPLWLDAPSRSNPHDPKSPLFHPTQVVHTPTITPDVSPTPTSTMSDTPTVSPSATPSNTLTASITASPTRSDTPVVSPTPTSTPTPSFTASPSFTPTYSATPFRGATLAYTEYEAESASLSGGTIVGPSTTVGQPAAEASGRKFVQLSALGNSVSFNPANDFNSIVVRYSVPDAAAGGGANYTLALYVGGSFVQELPMTSKYTWCYGGWGYPYNQTPSAGTPIHVFDEVHALLGTNYSAGTTVTLQRTAADTAAFYDIDFVDLENVAPALNQPANSLSATSDYGAVGDGVADDTLALQNLFAAAASQSKIAWLPTGTYRISSPITVTAETVQGAGMWYSTIHQVTDISVLRLDLSVTACSVNDLSLQGEVTNRVDSNTDSGLDYGAGNNSTVSNVWIEHTKTGWWVGNHGSITNGLVVSGCRVRDTFADGINLYKGASNCTITNSQFRSNGDDALASWSPTSGGINSNDTFSFNTIQCTWRADGLALYGGKNCNITDNVCSDTLDQSGILIEQGFTSNAFSGTQNILRNTLNRCGGYFGGNYGALAFWANQSNLAGSFVIDLMAINNSTYEGIEFNGSHNAGGETFSNISIVNTFFYGMQVLSNASGTATFSSTVVTGAVVGLQNSAGTNFTVIGSGINGNSGW